MFPVCVLAALSMQYRVLGSMVKPFSHDSMP
jgi:hypothetical protein